VTVKWMCRTVKWMCRVLWCALAHRSTKVTHVKTTKGTEYLLGKCARCGATTWERI
jgi:hypothetical protein